MNQLYNLVIPGIGFNLFMQVAELFGDITLNNKLMRCIKRNLPLDYDLTIFSEEFLEELFKKNPLIISASVDKSICIWDSETGDCLKTLSGHSGFVNAVAFSHDDNLIVSASCDSTIKIWDSVTGDCLSTLGVIMVRYVP